MKEFLFPFMIKARDRRVQGIFMADKNSSKEELARIVERLDESGAASVLAFAKRLALAGENSAQKTSRQKIMDRRLLDLRETVRKNPEKWTVDAMAENIGLTRSRLSVIYKEKFGDSPDKEKRKFLNQKALDLLSSTNKSVQKIASECGYNECENFIRAFRKSNGMSPLQFRKTLDLQGK